MLDLQTISDRIEIDDLITRYTRSVDTLDWERFDTVFTPDATIDYTASGGKKGSRDEVRDWLAETISAFASTITRATVPTSVSSRALSLSPDR